MTKQDDQSKRGARGEVIYGVGPIIESLRAEKPGVSEILVADGKQHGRVVELKALARSRGITVKNVPRKVLDGIVGKDVNHQGVAAYGGSAEYADADDLLAELGAMPEALCVVLDGVEDPQNLGAIIRTAECAGVDAVFIPERRSAGLGDTVSKTSAGAVRYMKVARVPNINRLLESLKERSFWVVGAAGEAEMEYSSWDFAEKTAIVMGSEGSGLHRLTSEKCDVLVKIPMYGRIGSLNVSVAAGVLLFEARRQRDLKE